MYAACSTYHRRLEYYTASAISGYLDIFNRAAVHSPLDRIHLGIKHTELE